MKNQNITFQQFLEKIKTIDVGELLEKAKTIKVEDIRSFKFNDLKEISKSPYFFPTLGILFATLTSILFFLPSFESLKEKQSKSQRYKFESQELPFIEEELMKRNNFHQIHQFFLYFQIKFFLILKICYNFQIQIQVYQYN